MEITINMKENKSSTMAKLKPMRIPKSWNSLEFELA